MLLEHEKKGHMRPTDDACQDAKEDDKVKYGRLTTDSLSSALSSLIPLSLTYPPQR